MKRCFSIWLCCALLALPVAAGAQDAPAIPDIAPQIAPALPEPGTIPMTAGAVSTTPHCFRVVNNAPYTVFGSFITDYYTRDDGQRARHRSNFRLEVEDSSEFCTYGPYYEGGKLELVLRTLVPVFSCRTRVDGDIVINGRKKPEGGTDTWAVCR